MSRRVDKPRILAARYGEHRHHEPVDIHLVDGTLIVLSLDAAHEEGAAGDGEVQPEAASPTKLDPNAVGHRVEAAEPGQ